jgi:23S rRNA pseudouridine1911/1915/1917 synthase
MENIASIILYKDHHYIVINKPAGVPVQKDKTGDTSLHEMIMAYAKQELYLCNRIDRPVSGIVILAKTQKAAADFQKQLGTSFIKKYLAIVPKIDIPQEAELRHFIGKSSKSNKAIIEDAPFKNAEAVSLNYKILKSADQYHLIEINTESGKFHQIRAQLAKAGMPVRGDVKYGARRSNKDRSVGLHAYSISFIHPSKNKVLEFQTEWPDHDIWPVFKP